MKDYYRCGSGHVCAMESKPEGLRPLVVGCYHCDRPAYYWKTE